MTGSNHKRAIAQLVSIDAWHKPLGEDNPRADLHVDLNFSEARVGGEEESELTFRLSLKRAELWLIISETEPVGIIRQSLDRGDDAQKLKRSIQRVVEKSAGAEGSSSLKIDLLKPLDLSASASAGLVGKVATSTQQKDELVSETTQFSVSYCRDTDKGDGWRISPSEGERLLKGRPWDPLEHPRVTLVDKRKRKSKSIAPTVSLEVVCLREDIDISDITLKNESLFRKLKSKHGFQNRLAAAEGYIREMLGRQALSAGSMENRFASITLANLTAEHDNG